MAGWEPRVYFSWWPGEDELCMSRDLNEGRNKLCKYLEKEHPKMLEEQINNMLSTVMQDDLWGRGYKQDLFRLFCFMMQERQKVANFQKQNF